MATQALRQQPLTENRLRLQLNHLKDVNWSLRSQNEEVLKVQKIIEDHRLDAMIALQKNDTAEAYAHLVQMGEHTAHLEALEMQDVGFVAQLRNFLLLMARPFLGGK